MDTTRVTTSEFQKDFDALSDRARHEPIVITQKGRDALVVIAAEEWERLRRRNRTVGLTSALPGEWIDAVRQADVPADFAHLDAEID